MAVPTLHERDATESTNDDARALALAGAPHGEAVLAREQRAGRGRDGRAFVSLPGGVYLSVVLRPTAEPAAWSLLPLVAGLAVVEALRVRGFDAWLKWPNDILLGGRKVAGILVESRFDEDPFAIVGVGVNVDHAPEDVADATCLREASSDLPTTRALAFALHEALLARVAAWQEDPARALADVRAACATLGRRVVVQGKKEGRAVDVAEDGALVVEFGNGERARVLAGDVRIRAE